MFLYSSVETNESMRTKSYNESRDEEIVKEITRNDKTFLFEILYNRYYSKILDKSYSLVKNGELAADLTRDILSKVYEKLKSYKGNSSFSSWIYSITYNHCIDFLREKKKLHYPDWNMQNDLPEIIDEVEDDNTLLNYDRLLKLLDLIHTEEKALLVMKYQDELSLKEISEALRISESAAKMRIKRAKARLLYLYKNLYGNYS
jgi:RNA polymerase sigma factor (sigma-70 family)